MDTILYPYRRVKELIQQNRRIVLLSSLTCGSICTYYAYKRYKPVYDNLRNDLKLMTQLAEEMYNNDISNQQNILVQRYIHNCNVSDITLRNFAAQIRTELNNRFDVDSIRKKLADNKKQSQQQSQSQLQATSQDNTTTTDNNSMTQSQTQNDLTLWNEFKNAAYSRAISCIYAISLLNALVRVQLSIVSRYVTNDNNNSSSNSMSSLPSIPFITPSNNTTTRQSPLPDVKPLPATVLEQLNKHYFSLSAHLQSTGLQALMHIIHSIVNTQLNKVQLNDIYTHNELSSLISDIRHQIDIEAGNFNFSYNNQQAYRTPFISYLWPNQLDIEQLLQHMTFATNNNDIQYEQLARDRLYEMIYETRMVLNSNDFQSALFESVDIGFKLLDQQFNDAFNNQIQKISFASTIVRMRSIYNTFLPEQNIESSLLLQALSLNNQNINNINNISTSMMNVLCQIIFFPLNQITALQSKLQQYYRSQITNQPGTVKLIQ